MSLDDLPKEGTFIVLVFSFVNGASRYLNRFASQSTVGILSLAVLCPVSDNLEHLGPMPKHVARRESR